MYDALVNTIRAADPAGARSFTPRRRRSPQVPTGRRITLSNGEDVSARLIVMANGLNASLRQNIGMTREIVSANHSISIGFDLKPVGRTSFDFPALTYYSERAEARMAYLTLFPIGATMRANLFVYRDMHDPWFRRLRETPEKILVALMPGLRKLTGEIEVVAPIKIRPVDLYVTHGYRQAGIVLVGDAFATSCPAAGTGANKVLTDVGAPVQRASAALARHRRHGRRQDRHLSTTTRSSRTAMRSPLPRRITCASLSIDAGLSWSARRWGKMIGQFGVGALRQTHERLSAKSSDRQSMVAGSNARP